MPPTPGPVAAPGQGGAQRAPAGTEWGEGVPASARDGVRGSQPRLITDKIKLRMPSCLGASGGLLLVPLALVLLPEAAEAQLFPSLPFDSRQFRIEQLTETHLRLIDEVEIDGDTFQFYADQVDIYVDATEILAGDVTFSLVATGNVVFVSAETRIAAERVEFKTSDQSAVFYNANGSINMGDEVDRSMFGTQEPDLLFYGEKIERVGPRTYRLTKGAFTSCVQPTPRWQVTASTLTINLDEHIVLRNSVIKVKNVPVFYLPAMYYPITPDGRATGFLMPTYGASSYRGTSLSNAFFWAITGSQDATAFHDWFSQTGQGFGGEYRYTRGGGSQGQVRTYFLNEHEAEISSGGGTTVLPARQSNDIRGLATQRIGSAWTARGQINYFSDITVQQTYNQNIFQASNRQRSFSGNLTGRLGSYQLSSTYAANETFFGDTQSTLNGGGPRIGLAQGKTELRGTPMYYSFNAEYVRLLRVSRFFRDDGDFEIDSGLNRMDFNPVLQIPFTKWPFLTIDSSVQWRGTYWDESLDTEASPVEQIQAGIGRSFLDLGSRATGPSFVKIWDTPNSGYSERMKHVIEPWVSIRRVSAIDNFDQVVRLEGIDSIVGNVTQVAFGLDNRIYAKRFEGGPESVSREIVAVSLTQSYYSDANAAEFDRTFRTSFNRTPPTNFSPVSLIVRTEPTRGIGGTLRTEVDSTHKALRTIAAEGSYELGGWLETRGGWSQRRFIENLPGFNDKSRLDHYLNSYTAIRNRDNTVGGIYTFNYDVLRSRYLFRRFIVYYNAQCCGVSLEYQMFNFEGLGRRAPVPRDRRINFSFTMAGLGTFANVFGAFGGGGGGY